MTWLFPSVIATTAGTFLLVLLYFYLYLQDENKYMLVWAVSWSVYFVRFLFMLAIISGNKGPLLLMGNQLSSLLSGIILLWGTYIYVEKKMPRIWIAVAIVSGFWIIASISFRFPFMLMSIPTFFLLAAVNIYTGVIFMKAENEAKNERLITGISFVLWGIHKADYPFLRPAVWFAPLGYLIGAILEFSVAIGVVLLYFQRSKARIEESAVHMRTVIETIPDLVWLKDPNGVYLFCNPKYERLYGAKESEIVGKTDYDFVDKELADFFREKDKAAIEAGKSISNEETVIYADDGHKEFLDTLKTPMYASTGKLIGVLGIARDITHRQQIESDFHALVETTVGHIGQNLFDITVNEICKWLDCECAILGEIRDEDTATVLSMVMDGSPVHHDSYKLDGTPFLDVRRKGFCFYPEHVCQLFPDDKDLIEMNAAGYIGLPLIGDENEAIGILCAISRKKMNPPENAKTVLKIIAARLAAEIKRKRVEETLRLSEERLNSILQTSPNPIVVYDMEGFPQFVNPSFTDVFGWTFDEIKGKTIPFVPDDQKDLTLSQLKQIHETGKPSQFLTQRLTKSNEILDVNIHTVVYRDSEGNNIGLVVNLTDITEQLKIENQLRQAQKMESVGRLAGGVAHDFNNMLSIILGNSEILMDDTGPDHPFFFSLKEIQNAARRSTNLTRQLLAFARKQTISPKVLDLNHTIEGMLKMLRRLIGENIALLWHPDKSLGAVKIDPSQIDQILANLCINARDAITDVGSVTIETANAIVDENYCRDHVSCIPGEYVLISVSDNGSGMDKETIKNLFEPFFTTKEFSDGTGLGLATVYGIVKQNKGFINVYSEIGRGTTFKIYLPRHMEEDLVQHKKIRQKIRKGNETILLVEDETAILKMTEMMLTRLGYEVLTANTPDDAIRIAKQDGLKIHLLMTDVVMPAMNGRDLAKIACQSHPGLKCLYMSGYTANIIAHSGILDEGLNFISKPFTKHDLSVQLRQILDGGK